MIRFHTTVLAIYLAIVSVVLGAAIPSALSNSSASGEGVLVKRNPRPAGVRCCNDEDMKFHVWHPWWTEEAENAIKSIRDKGNTFFVAKKDCPHVMIKGGIKVSVCNDNDHPITPEYKLIGTYAQEIVNGCKYPKAPDMKTYSMREQVCGQQFDAEGHWNVIVNLQSDTIKNPA